jgi:hypothetical protein
VAAQAAFKLAGRAGSLGGLPDGDDMAEVGRVENGEDEGAVERADGDAGIFVPAGVEIILGALGRCRPYDLRHGIRQHAKFGFALCECGLGLDLAGDFRIHAVPVGEDAVFVESRGDAS